MRLLCPQMSYGEGILNRYILLLVPHAYVQHHRPDWLLGLELDFFFPFVRVGIEFQGDQHYVNTDFCQNSKGVIYRDGSKFKLCKLNNVTLIRVDACDLEYTRLLRKFKAVRRFASKAMLHENKASLRALNKESTQYRRLLVSKFDSVTARRKGNSRREALLRHS